MSFLSQRVLIPSPQQQRNHQAFDAERKIAGKTHYWHFKDLEIIDKGHAVDPLGGAIVVPHLPEKAALQCSQRR